MTDADTDANELLTSIADSAADLLGRRNHRERVRQLREAPMAFDRDIWGELADAGWPAILVPEADGGLGLGLQEAATVALAAGEHLLPEPWLPVFQNTWVLANAPGSELRSRLLSELVTGDCVLGLAWQESVAEMEPGKSETQLKRASDGWLLNGKKRFVEPAGADGYLLLVEADEPVVLWLPIVSEGLQTEERRRVDGGLLVDLHAEDVLVTDEQILLRGEAATEAVSAGLDIARILQSSELIGIGRRVLALTIEYVGVRRQFGQPIGSFQALQHRLVDARMQLDLAAAALEQVHVQYSAPGMLAVSASRAKARASAAALGAARLAIQLHGAMGTTDECDVGLYFKRALAIDASLGCVSAHLRRYSERLECQPFVDAGDPVLGANIDDEAIEELSGEQLRGRVQRFLQRHYPAELRQLQRAARWLEIRDWRRVLAEQGWVAPAWPREHGGLGLSAAQLMAFHEAMQEFGVARWVDQGVEMLGPLLISHGSEAQREYYLPRILSGEHVWAQGYSEPNAGSDLASLSTAGVIDGEEIVINGRKTWSSHADEATHIFMLVRTDRAAKPQAGISFVLVDLATPGIEVHPIRDLRGDEPFCEVTFDDVRIPLNNLVGNLNDGWTVAKSLLGFERLAVSNPSPAINALNILEKYGRYAGLFGDPDFRRRYAELALDVADLGALYHRYADRFKRGEPLGDDISMLKISSSDTWQRVAQFLLEATAEPGALVEPLPAGGEHVDILAQTFGALPASIYGGTNEILKNVIARRVLELPV